MENLYLLIFSLIADTVFSIIYPTFYSSVAELRIKKWQYVLIMFLIFILFTPWQYIFPIPHIVVYVSGIVINLLGLIIFSKEKITRKIIYTLIPYVVDIVGSSIYLVIRLCLMPEWQPVFGSKMISEVLELIIIMLQSILSLLIISKVLRRKKLKINNITAIYVIALIIVQMYMATFIMYIYWTKVHFSIFCTVLIAYILILAGLTIAVLYYNGLMNKKQIKQNMIENQYRFMNVQYEQLQNSYISYKKLRHDIKEHLNVVNALAMQGHIEELKTYTNTLTQNWEALSSKTFCNVPAVDIILVEKYNAANASGIKADFIVNNVKEVNADNVYLSSIFANILNNALEASSHCSHEPYIHLRCGIMMEKLVITCRNSMPDSPYQKSDAQNHGYGLHIIDDLVKLLGGTFVHECDNSIFTSVVTIPTNERRTE